MGKKATTTSFQCGLRLLDLTVGVVAAVFFKVTVKTVAILICKITFMQQRTCQTPINSRTQATNEIFSFNAFFRHCSHTHKKKTV